MFEKFYEMTAEAIAGKAKTKIYRTLIIWLLILHLDLIYFALFANEELVYKTSFLIKSEYISVHYLNVSDVDFWIFESIKLFVAVGLAIASVWIWPRLISEHAYKQEIENEEILEIAKIKSKHRINQAEKKVTKDQLVIAQAQQTIIETEKETMDKEKDALKTDYASFKSNRYLYQSFIQIIESLFEHNGFTRVPDYDGDIMFKVDSKLLAYCVGDGIVEFDNETGRIYSTEKGNFFIAQYQLDTANSDHSPIVDMPF